jgi:3-oxoacyl-[acyl-carrier protein] reductase
MDLGLSEKTALITGSSSGLGFAIAKTLLAENVNTIINGVNEEKLERSALILKEETKKSPTFFAGDVTSHKFSEELFDFVSTKYSKLDILITNAGGPPPGKFVAFSDDDWDNAIELSFLSHVRLIRSFLPLLSKSSSPSVLTITSFSVKQPVSNLILSNSIRSATIGLTKTLALEYGSLGIRFNSILPGWTNTERVKQLIQNRAQENKTNQETELHRITNTIALGRLASPEEFANVAVFLVSPAASYLTGVMLSVDGGAVKGTF